VAEAPSYVILGRGRWAKRMHGVLAGEGRRIVAVEDTRRTNLESDTQYGSRLTTSLAASGARVAWLCVSPGPHIPRMVEAAIAAGLHCVVEKPWQCSRAESESLTALALTKNRLIAIHYQYCLLKDVEAWRHDFRDTAGLRFGGHFAVNHSGRLGIPALDDLGSHLLAIRAYAVPQSTISEVRCGYDAPDERRIWIETRDKKTAAMDFLGSKESVIQRYIHELEAAIAGAEFAFDLNFASRVADDLAAVKAGGRSKPE
jgi:predicted dehydrogenase